MALYVKSHKLDRETGADLVVMLNSQDAQDEGINKGDIVSLTWRDVFLYVIVEITDTELQPGELGIYEDIWTRYQIPTGSMVAIALIDRPDSIDYIKKKLLGEKYTEEQLKVITADVSDRKIREVEIAYFMSTFFNPGFDDDEVLWTIRGMAEAGDILDFTDIKGNKGTVVDKHSIGGVAGKGITPLLVSIISASGLVIPNTSTRAITSPAGTTDILEVLMPVAMENEQLMSAVRETGACLAWGGALRLSPADDVLINVERGLHLQSMQKLLVSIIAKKVSMGISHIVIDIPYGDGTKVEKPDDAEVLGDAFVKLFDRVGIKCVTHKRLVKGPDGYGIGPVLECQDLLKVFERADDRSMHLENSALDITGALLELAGVADPEKGKAMALEKLDSGEALEQFWKIAKAQGGDKTFKSDDLTPGEFKYEVMADKNGRIDHLSNKEIVQISRALGNPFIKEAGIRLNKNVGDSIKEGEVFMTLYATSPERLETGKKEVNLEKLISLI